MYLRFSNQATVVILLVLFGMPVTRQAAAQREPFVIQPATVVRLELTDPISSRTAPSGKRVDVVLDEEDRSGFPVGTRFEGRVTQVRRAANGRPALLDLEFRRAILPDGTLIPISADPASLSTNHVRTAADGHLEARRANRSFDWKWVGYGAAGGAVLGEVLGDDFLKSTLLGGFGGAVYAYLNRGDDNRDQEVELPRGTNFGIRMQQAASIDPRADYRFSDREKNGRERLLGSREEHRLDGASGPPHL